MELNEVQILQENALIQRLRDECIVVTLKRKDEQPKLSFKIDYRDVETWKKSLIEKGERFSMFDKRTGETIYETHERTNEDKV
jgi:hypothetical protein